MNNSLDTLFYSLFVRVGKQYGGEEHPLGPAILAALLLSLMSFNLVMSVLFVINYWCDVKIIHHTHEWFLYGVAVALMIINYFLFIHKRRYLTIMESYKSLDVKEKKKKTLLWFLLFVLSTLSLPIVGFIYIYFMQ